MLVATDGRARSGGRSHCPGRRFFAERDWGYDLGVIVLILAVLCVIALVLLGRWLLRRIEDYPATLFGPLDSPPHSS